MVDLLVPCGLNEAKEIILARVADRASSYTCVVCAAPLVLKAGEAKYFAHASDGLCSRESVEYKAARMIIKKQLEQKTAKFTFYYCVDCKKSVIYPIKDNYDSIQEERSDFVCIKDGKPIKVIKIWHIRSDNTEKMFLPWIEISAIDVLMGQGLPLVKNCSMWQDSERPSRCHGCDVAMTKRISDLEERIKLRGEIEHKEEEPLADFAFNLAKRMGLNPEWVK